MDKYEYGIKLSSKEFENLICDVLDIRESEDFEVFGEGKDSGIDGRAENKKGKIIVQAKICNYSFNVLLRKLQKEELPKVRKLKPKRYILAVSCPLTPQNKKEIKEIFKDFIIKEKDIITSTELDKYFRNPKYERILDNYSSLWLTRVNKLKEELKKEINKPTINKTIWMLDDLAKIKRYFVPTKKYYDLLNDLDNYQTLLITGDPASGKTTNAKMLIYELLESKRVEEVYWIENTQEIYSLYDKDKKQAFLLDDYWGSTFIFSKRPPKEEQDLLQIIDKFEQEKNHFLILTSREYVLEQMIKNYPELKNKTYENREFFLLKEYTDSEKAQILFKQAYDFNLREDIKLFIKGNIKKLISMPNYTPRIVSDFIKENQNLDAYDFMEKFYLYLDEPYKYFDQIFDKLSLDAKLLCFILAISNPPILLESLKDTFNHICKFYFQIKPSNFKSGMEELENSFTNTRKMNHEVVVDFRNYSIHDYMNDKLEIYIHDYEEALIKGATYFNQLVNLCDDNPLSLTKESLKEITDRLVDEFDKLKFCDYENFDISFDYTPYHKPNEYLMHKLFVLHRLAKYNENIAPIIENRLKEVLNKIDKTNSYKISDFEMIPEMIRCATKIGCHFDKEEVCRIYLTNSHFLSDIFYAKFFPKEYLKYIKECFKALKEIKPINILDRIQYDMDELAYRDLDTEMFIIEDEIKTILDIMNIPYTKEIKELIETYQPDFSNYKPLPNKRSKRTPEEKSLDDIIKDTDKWFFNRRNYSMNKTKFQKLVRESALSKEEKRIVKEGLEGIFMFIHESNEKYINTIFELVQKNHLESLSLDKMPKIVNLLFKNKKELLKKTYYFAYDYLCLEKENFLLEDLLGTYQFTEKELEWLLKRGIVEKVNKWYHIADDTLLLYLVTLYTKNKENITKEVYDKIFNISILNSYMIFFFEEFDQERLNQIYIKPEIEEVFNHIHSLEDFIEKYCEFEFYDNGGCSTDIPEIIDLISFNGFTDGIAKVLKEKNLQNSTQYPNLVKEKEGSKEYHLYPYALIDDDLYNQYDIIYKFLLNTLELIKTTKGKKNIYI